MVNVDDGTPHQREKVGAEDLHVASHHNQLDTMLFHDREHLSLLLGFRLFGDRTHHKWNVEEFGPRRAGLVIGDDDGNVDMQFVALMPLEQISQTVVLFRDEHSDSRAMAGMMDLVPHLEDLGDRREGGRNVIRRNLPSFGCKLHPHQKIVSLFIRMVIGIQDVAPEVVNEPRDPRDDSLTILTMDQENNRFSSTRHEPSLTSWVWCCVA